MAEGGGWGGVSGDMKQIRPLPQQWLWKIVKIVMIIIKRRRMQGYAHEAIAVVLTPHKPAAARRTSVARRTSTGFQQAAFRATIGKVAAAAAAAAAAAGCRFSSNGHCRFSVGHCHCAKHAKDVTQLTQRWRK